MSLRLSSNLVLSVEAARRVFAFLALRGAGGGLVGSEGSDGSEGTHTSSYWQDSDGPKVEGGTEGVGTVGTVGTLTDSALKSAKSTMSRWGKGPLVEEAAP